MTFFDIFDYNSFPVDSFHNHSGAINHSRYILYPGTWQVCCGVIMEFRAGEGYDCKDHKISYVCEKK